MRRTILGAAFCAFALPAVALADCGEVSITEMSFSSSIITTEIAAFLMEQGYGCEVSRVPSDQVPAITSLSENNEPDLVTELWTNSTGEVYAKLKEEGRITELNEVLQPGGVEGWWIPSYLAEEYPELTTIQGILDNPGLVGNRFHNCMDGWVCRRVNLNNARAWGMEEAGIEIYEHGSGETMASSLASAYEAREPWFGYYWEPTELMGRYDMVPVDFGPPDMAIHIANTNLNNPDPQASAYPPSKVLTVANKDFVEREPEIADMMSKLHFDTSEMSALLAWKEENNASNEETAVHFLQNNPDEWAGWLNDEARARLVKLLQ